jgi:hypothetical protein
MFGIPRVAARAVRLRLSRHVEAEFGRVGLADIDEPRSAELLDEIRVVIRYPARVLQETRAGVVRITLAVDVEIFDANGTPLNSPSGIYRGLLAGLVEQRRDDRVDLRVESFRRA